MRVPEVLAADLERRFGRVESVRAVGGGCVSSACRIELGGGSFFLKFDERAADDFFAVEADALGELRAAGAVRVPRVIEAGAASGVQWLLLEWLEPRRPREEDERELGRAIARLHGVRGEGWGWHRDGFIGRLPQSNQRNESWAEFWWSERIEPQLRLAGSLVDDSAPGWGELRRRLPRLLNVAAEEGPSLLHGDLWGGNVLYTVVGPAVADPACYFGHREVDLAMSRLFGGFGPPFYEGYGEVWPLQAGSEARRHAYQLYYLLVHVNLFGRSYVERTHAALAAALEA